MTAPPRNMAAARKEKIFERGGAARAGLRPTHIFSEKRQSDVTANAMKRGVSFHDLIVRSDAKHRVSNDDPAKRRRPARSGASFDRLRTRGWLGVTSKRQNATPRPSPAPSSSSLSAYGSVQRPRTLKMFSNGETKIARLPENRNQLS